MRILERFRIFFFSYRGHSTSWHIRAREEVKGQMERETLQTNVINWTKKRIFSTKKCSHKICLSGFVWGLENDNMTQARIQDLEGGVSYIQKGGFVQEFQERIQIVAGSWANQQAKKIADSHRGGVR